MDQLIPVLKGAHLLHDPHTLVINAGHLGMSGNVDHEHGGQDHAGQNRRGLRCLRVDRPDLARTQGCPRVADQLRARTALVHSLDPTRRTYITVSAWDGFEAFPYRHFARAADILGLVVYPYAINRSSPSSIDQAIAAADDARIAHYWAVVQDFGDGFYRQPTASELRDELLRWKRSRMEGYFVRDWNAGHLDSKPSHLKVYREANGVAAAASTSSSSSTFAEATTTSTGTADTTAPTTPRNLQATLHSRAVYLTWSASSDNRGVALYRVLRDGQFDGVTALTTFVDFPLPGVRHSYQVSAVDSSGNQSVPAAVSIAVPKTSTEYVGWDVFCSYSNSLKDDPIVKPAQPGASHLHDFFGNKSVTAFSTYSSMSTGGSSCPFADDRAGYWAPALFADGHQVLPGTGRDLLNGHRLQIKVRYFVTAAQAAGVTYSSIPADLRMIVGVSIATTPAENPSLGTEMWWGCSHDEDRALGLRLRPNAAPGRGRRLRGRLRRSRRRRCRDRR